jgi:D-alanyl-D-alanine dipeptidase
VAHFVRWAHDLQDLKKKAEFYPGVKKEDLFRDGYIAEKSGHSRGSTVDLAIDGVDFGTPFDYFDPASHTDSPAVSEEARKNRGQLRTWMEEAGFKNLPEEWWHYTLKEEPHPDTYFDFPVESVHPSSP